MDPKKPFHDVGRIFPEDVDVISVTPSTTVSEALRIMLERRYSQLPVIDDGRLRGVFSLWSLAQHIVTIPRVSLQDQNVEDLMEELPVVTVNDSLDKVLEQLNRHDAVLVGGPRGIIQAVATATDVLAYFFRVARPYVLLQEIELALRELIATCAPPEKLAVCIERALAKEREQSKRPLPKTLEDMTFEEYRLLINNKENWPLFDGVLGRNRDLAASKLERAREIRNKLFHFREDISVIEHETLSGIRQWMFDKITNLKRIRGGTGDG
jgi:CBS domain-containing protein